MFDPSRAVSPEGLSAHADATVTLAPTIGELQDALTRLAVVDGQGLDEAELIDHLAAMERLKGALAAAQARVTEMLVRARTSREAAEGIRPQRRGQGLAAEIALARRCSPHRGARDLGLARALVNEMPETLGALTRGDIPEWRATLVVRETAVLSREHRARVDAELADRLPQLGDRGAAAEARKIGYRLDPGSAIRRTRGAEGDRYVSIRPAPDTMSYLTGFLPVAQGVACQAALMREADSLRAQGDERSRGQIMADTLVERVTGQESAEAVSVEVALVMTDETLLGDVDSPADVPGYGPVPAALARRIVREAGRVWLRRLFTRPGEGSLVAMESRRREFEGELRRFLIIRDQVCRTQWCDAPVRHGDHVTRAVDGGETSAENGQGLCEACNYAKEAQGWRSRKLTTARHQVQIITPTGHTYVSTAPEPPGAGPPLPARLERLRSGPSVLEDRLRALLAG